MIKLNRPPCPNPTALSGGDYKNPDNKLALKASTFDKCMYCESKITHIDYGDIEHIKPKSKYPSLEFTWSNLGFSCTRCNRQFKNNNYDEVTPFLNPYVDEPSGYIVAIGAMLFPKQGNERGDLSINGLGLNRPEIIEKRQEKINEMDKAIKACFRSTNSSLKDFALQELKNEANNDKEYSMVIKALFLSHDIAV
ncbi:MAG: HNH endonuclease [Epsilonproteobacteria bacterium]|nr:HNH endonuclease [Campylobacterota bacterium]